MSLLQKVGVPCGVVSDAVDLANDQQLESREFFIQLPHPVLGNTRIDSTPVRLSRTPAQFRRSAPLLGQDNHYVYQKLLGMDEPQLSYYIEKGIIG